MTDQPFERCGNPAPRVGGAIWVECTLRPGHQGSHADDEGARWTERAKVDTCVKDAALMTDIGYLVRCPHCSTTVPPTHWTKHVQRHHPDAASRGSEPELSDPTQCSGEEGFCPEHGFHRQSLKQPAERSFLGWILRAAEHQAECARLATGDAALIHQGMAAAHEIDAEYLRRYRDAELEALLKRIKQADADATDLRERLRVTSDACFTATCAAEDAAARGVRFQARLDAARDWARHNLPADQAEQLCGVLRGDTPGGGGSDSSDRAADLARPAEQSLLRPEHEDGTPYRYGDFAAEGWDRCDGCRIWIRGYTPDNPHECEPALQVSRQATETPDA